MVEDEVPSAEGGGCSLPAPLAGDDGETDAATRAFWWSQLQLRKREEECSALRAQCDALEAQCSAQSAQCLALRRRAEEEEAARDATVDGAVRARDCALGMLQDSEDRAQSRTRTRTHAHTRLR